jgi:hypothetical protein
VLIHCLDECAGSSLGFSHLFFDKIMTGITLLFEGFTSVFEGKKSRSHKLVEIMVFLTFLLVDGWIRIRIQIRIRTNNDESGFGRPKNIRIFRIQIHNTVNKTLSIE